MTALILSVDDNDAARYSTSRVLRRAGYEVLEAATASEGLRIAAESRPRLVILDVNLPDLSGFDVCRQLKAEPLSVSMLILQTDNSNPGSASMRAPMAT
jgi:CheY-like chemotaxis protein